MCRLPDMEMDVDWEKKTRRSSILKPQKPRNPLAPLDFSEVNPDSTLGKATRRVSFASSNFVKPFAADPEKNTIWDNTYEEEVDRTDSTKSSCEQTQATKISDFTNTTYAVSMLEETPYTEKLPSLGVSSASAQCKIYAEETKNITNEIPCPEESLISIARKSRSGSVYREGGNKAVDSIVVNNISRESSAIAMLNKENVKIEEASYDIPVPGVFVDITDKENVYAKGTCAVTKSVRYIKENFDYTQSVPCANNPESSLRYKNFNLQKSDSVMEFTCIGSEENIIQTNWLGGVTDKGFDDRTLQDSCVDVSKRTVYFDDSKNAMEFTLVNETEKSCVSKRTAGPHPPAQSSHPLLRGQNTICFDDSESNMEFTETFPVKAIQERKVDITTHTELTNKSECSMEFTTLIGKVIDHTASADVVQEEDMDLTTVSPVKCVSDLIKERPIVPEYDADTLPLPTTIGNTSKSYKESLSQSCRMDFTYNSKGCDVKRLHSLSPAVEAIKKRKVQQPFLEIETASSETETSKINTGEKPTLSTDLLINRSKISDTNLQDEKLAIPEPAISTSLSVNQSKIGDTDPKPNPQVLTLPNSNILYSEPMKIKLKPSQFVPMPELSAHMQNFDGTVGAIGHVSTPATSFHISMSAMSPCSEDTQQLIQATFSKPETLGLLNKNATTEATFNVSRKDTEVLKVKEKPPTEQRQLSTDVLEDTSFDKKVNEATYIKHSHTSAVENTEAEKLDNVFFKIGTESVEKDENCLIEDVTPLVLVAAEDFDASTDRASPPCKVADVEVSPKEGDSNSADYANYTQRSNFIFSNIQEYLSRLPVYEPEKYTDKHVMSKLTKQIEENYFAIKRVLSKPWKQVPDLEERHRRDIEASRITTSTDEEDLSGPKLELVAPTTVKERICEIAKGTKQYWDFVKNEGDFYYFSTLFATLGFKVHIHPELCLVYSVETFKNLADFAKSICWYELKVLQQKLTQQNLLSVLGTKFDIFALLDYISMSVEEIINFHIEYNSLAKKYAESHHFRMNPDFSVTFEIINLKLIICWIITVKLSLANMFSVSNGDVTAVAKVGMRVNEEHIKTIVENTPKGPQFFRNFIEAVDAYVVRIARRIEK
ncbi:hypothetical protein NQ315_000790 [Exocentrus adspersus]|uniref:Uncharacterized protein n=1 Tax=Exocentrus adspersus TaxID=1586481 RepID=A0AAV8WDE9_9CUCU|nr:hypothetical protein NQ315_000790 [Exocentrus adspersus]